MKISLDFVYKGTIDDKSVLVQVMARRVTGKPSPEPVLMETCDIIWCH